MQSEPTGKTCVDCGIAVFRGPRCRRCAAALRSAQNIAANPLTPCKICGQPITGRQRRKAIYCSHACRVQDPASYTGPPRNSVTKVCAGCGKTFEIPVSNAARYTYCTRACSLAHRGRDAVCERCGAPFRHGRTVTRRHCSEACRRPPLLINCAHCGDAIRIVPSRESRSRYCSRRCYAASDAETGIERAVRLVLEGLRIRYVAQAQVGPWIVDFLIGHLVIEADGTYWHSLRPDVDRRKTAALESRGLVVWRLPETDISSAGFGERLCERVAAHEAVHGPFARLVAGENFADASANAVARRHNRSARPDPHQLTLGV